MADLSVLILSFFRKLLSNFVLWRKIKKIIEDNFFKEHDHYNESVGFLTKKHKNIEILQICPENLLKSSVIGTSKEDLIQDYHCGLEKGMDFLNDNFL